MFTVLWSTLNISSLHAKFFITSSFSYLCIAVSERKTKRNYLILLYISLVFLFPRIIIYGPKVLAIYGVFLLIVTFF